MQWGSYLVQLVVQSTLDDFHVHTVCMCICTTDEVICDLLQLKQKRRDSGLSIDTVWMKSTVQCTGQCVQDGVQDSVYRMVYSTACTVQCVQDSVQNSMYRTVCTGQCTEQCTG